MKGKARSEGTDGKDLVNIFEVGNGLEKTYYQKGVKEDRVTGRG